jgi:hypothetical protein
MAGLEVELTVGDDLFNTTGETGITDGWKK